MVQILVFGSNGMLGRYMWKYLETGKKNDVIIIDKSIIDVEKVTYESLTNFLSTYPNSVVINCVGRIPQRSDNNLSKYIQINTLFPHMLAHCCIQTNSKLIHITTDCVFTGLVGGYDENDIHDETNYYGVSKSKGEPGICCCIRTSIIGEEVFNKKSLIEWIKNNAGNKVRGYCNHYWNGVTCLQLAMIVEQIINKNMYWLGVKHIFSPTTVSKYDIIKYVSDIYELNIEIDSTNTEIIDKSLSSIYPINFDICPLYDQIIQLKKFSPILFAV